MVSYLSIASLVFVWDVTQSTALATAEQFRQFAARAGGAHYVGAPPAGSLSYDSAPTLDPNKYYFFSKEGVVAVNKSNGRIPFFSQRVLDGFNTEWNSQLALSSSELTTLASMYMTSAGFPQESIALRARDPVYGDEQNASMWNYACVRRYMNHYEYHIDYDALFSVEHVSGRLSHMTVPALPAPIIDEAVEVSPTLATASAASMLSTATGSSTFFVLHTLRPVVWSPKLEHLDPTLRFLSTADVALGQQFRGKLVYWGELRTTGTRARRYWVYINARTGAPLGAASVGDGFGETTSSKVPLPTGKVDIVVRGRAIQVTDVKLYVSNPPQDAGRTRPFSILGVGTVWSALFDSKSGLILVANRWYRPSASLLRILR